MKRHVFGRVSRRVPFSLVQRRCDLVRLKHTDSRQRITDFWIPTVNVQKQDAISDATQLLIRAGYLRQAYAGIFQMLPLGLRVQDKLERLIDKHMRSIQASKVSLSSVSSLALWQRSGRWKPGAEFFTFKDRKDTEWLLAPTHEEEITTLLADLVQTSQQLPVRLYQITRKYRDEKRPRGGLLRGREFVMKDLYTFDTTLKEAHATYDDIRGAYRNFLDELTVSYIEARAESGNMGGNLSHEYHFPNAAGEDIVITCSDCNYARNEEFVSQKAYRPQVIDNVTVSKSSTAGNFGQFIQEDFVSKDGRSLVRAIAPRQADQDATDATRSHALNSYAIKAALDGVLEIDSGLEHPLTYFEGLLTTSTHGDSTKGSSIFYLLDSQVEPRSIHDLVAHDMDHFASKDVKFYIISASKDGTNGISLLKQRPGDPCPECSNGKLQLHKAIEIGHTFHLGTRYSSKLGLCTRSPDGKTTVPVEMGCHGIGVTRLIAAVASCLADERGLNWPRVIAPFEVVILVAKPEPNRLQAAEQIYDQLSTSELGVADVLLDDRQEQGLGWKLKDADMIGYPVLVVLGKGFDRGMAEVQCRRLNIKQDVEIDRVVAFVHGLLKQL
ncbi:prolyl-tRNA synthetase [Capronia epimyces CBS 606.96]|uniref:proline--tRNA ligase n=1 Tax=Capronia epimyces CBS 606.96 TaxID=1182542 RepID=W9XW42_9EURO|nr:prolyl-tRNA synthetase [Capronia epimyces CBS 606.96]EXJ84787.1 prolyl-tRNA synthetase [Capronia epimyces CBS 606.96]